MESSFQPLVVLARRPVPNQNKGIEIRMIMGGNFVNHPSIKIYNLNSKKENFPKAQEIENRGFYIGLHPKPISNEILRHLEENLLKIES